MTGTNLECFAFVFLLGKFKGGSINRYPLRFGSTGSSGFRHLAIFKQCIIQNGNGLYRCIKNYQPPH